LNLMARYGYFFAAAMFGIVGGLQASEIKVATHLVANEGQFAEGILYSAFPSGLHLLRDGMYVGGVRITFVGAKGAAVRAEEKLKAKFNYFKGRDERVWIRGVRTYGRVIYEGIYPGIDLIFTGIDGGRLEFQWVVHPGADPARIRMRVEGGEAVPADGGVEIRRDGRVILRMDALRAYQGADEVEVEAAVDGDVLTYTLGNYDPSHTLVIDPELSTLTYSTFLGGSGWDEAYDITFSTSGVFVVGSTRSVDFPATPGAYDTLYADTSDVFVAKFSPDLSTLEAATFVGGTLNDEAKAAVFYDGYLYVAGYTGSSDFPTTPGAYDGTLDGFSDGFILKLDESLSALLASTFIGGWSYDGVEDIFVSDGSVYAVGSTGSDFPTTSGAYDETYNGSTDAFVVRMDGDLTVLLASTFVGGSNWDVAYALAYDGSDIYLVGFRLSDHIRRLR